jgi:riboflavin synthase
MFTGIITDIGTIISIEKNGDYKASIKTSYDMASVDIGASIACSGVCLTVISKGENSFTVDISAETISCTNIYDWENGSLINLERALKIGDELGGHIVSGHVDGLATLDFLKAVDGSRVMTFIAPDKLAMYIAAKGSVTLNGTSLTVNEVSGCKFTVNIIPHTLENTTLGDLFVGRKVNLEIDMLARYVERMVGFKK